MKLVFSTIRTHAAGKIQAVNGKRRLAEGSLVQVQSFSDHSILGQRGWSKFRIHVHPPRWIENARIGAFELHADSRSSPTQTQNFLLHVSGLKIRDKLIVLFLLRGIPIVNK